MVCTNRYAVACFFAKTDIDFRKRMLPSNGNNKQDNYSKS